VREGGKMWGREIGVKHEVGVNDMRKVSADNVKETKHEGGKARGKREEGQRTNFTEDK